MFVHPSCVQQETQSTPLHTQVPVNTDRNRERKLDSNSTGLVFGMKIKQKMSGTVNKLQM